MVLKRKLPSRTTEFKSEDGASASGTAAQGTPPSPKDEVTMSPQGGADFEADVATDGAAKTSIEEPMSAEARPRKTIDLDDILGVAETAPKNTSMEMNTAAAPPRKDPVMPSKPTPPSAQPPVEESRTAPSFDTPPSAPPKRAAEGIVPPPSFADEMDLDDIPAAPQAPLAPPPTAEELDMGAGNPNEGSWDLEELVDVSGPGHSSSADTNIPETPVSGVYGAAPEVASPYAPPKVDSPKQPPWKHSATADEKKKPEMPPISAKQKTVRPGSASRGGFVGAAGSLLVLGGLIAGIYVVYTDFDKVSEMVARWTGALNQVSQDLPVEPPIAINKNAGTAIIADADTMELAGRGGDDTTSDEQATNGTGGGGDEPPVPTDSADAAGGALVEFADVMPDEAEKPIVADGSEDMPEDVNAFAKLMEKISEKRKEKRQTDSAKLPDEPEDLDPEDIPVEERSVRNAEVINSVEDELTAYRKALSQTDNPALKPRPSQFFDRNNPTMPTPGATNRPAPEGQNNPIMNEPVAAAPKKPDVRSMNDFDVEMFEPGGNRVRVPRGIKPRLSAADFPALEVLSLVPNYGLIGVTKGREGVLLVGDTFEGWELIAVQSAYAEFRFGDRKYIVSMKNANR